MKQYEATELIPLKRYTQGGLVISFGLSTIVRNSEKGEVTSYPFHRVKVEEKADYGTIVSAIIRAKYSPSEELALINNNIENPSPEHSEEYAVFNDFRKKAKILAKCVLDTIDIDSKTVPQLDEIAEALSMSIRNPDYTSSQKTGKVLAINQIVYPDNN